MTARRTRVLLAGDRGQVTVEFLGMLPTIIVTLVVVWQFVLLGYTYTLAGNAADEAVRAGTAAHPGARSAACAQAGRDKLGDAWESGAEVSCGGSGFVTAEVTLHVPVLVPGLIDFPFPVRAHAGAVEEEDGD
ncbi:TadE/TadG family type IV pilus assembly protein [Streptomyces sp. NBC_00199]|uniref:TadE/TadG family type IV pilus assembly protein n=1 Tax=Streptomyces sp. NBC_00199 TaxID=2975678 RepID=UPI002257EECD|nr:TadE family protein [Streptomyces sp. NBC_00199]MCX5266936.1 pilus assembly protein [Streptomyces sp. NBC_00199]